MSKPQIKRFSLLLLNVIVVMILTGSIQLLYAQVGPGLGTNPCPGGPPCDPEHVPISGIEVLLALGGMLGVRKLLSSKRTK